MQRPTSPPAFAIKSMAFCDSVRCCGMNCSSLKAITSWVNVELETLWIERMSFDRIKCEWKRDNIRVWLTFHNQIRFQIRTWKRSWLDHRCFETLRLRIGVVCMQANNCIQQKRRFDVRHTRHLGSIPFWPGHKFCRLSILGIVLQHFFSRNWTAHVIDENRILYLALKIERIHKTQA